MSKNLLTKTRIPAFLTDYLGLVAALFGLILIFALSTDYFFTLNNFRIIAGQIPAITIVAVGMTYVLIIAGIDLSVGSVMALSGAVLAVCLTRIGLPLPVAIAASLAVGTLCGAVNGIITIGWALPPFIVTLGMLEVARGATFHVTQSDTIAIGAAAESITRTSVLGMPLSFIIAVAIVVLAQLVLSRTVFGRYLVAIGTNEEAVRLSGVDPRPLKFAVFALCGLLTSVAAVLETARLKCLDPNAGQGMELDAIAAVVIGGTSLMGGRGSVVRSFFGVLIIAVLTKGLSQGGTHDANKRLATGAVIVAAVILDYYRHRLPKRSTPN